MIQTGDFENLKLWNSDLPERDWVTSKVVKKLCLCLLFIGLFPLPFSGFAQEVFVHEMSVLHMESSGGWIAAEKGFYGKLKVMHVEGGPGISPIQKVVAAIQEGSVAFGVDLPETILRAREEKGVDLIALSADFQNSAMRVISWRPIRSTKDIYGPFGMWIGYETKARCAIGKDWEKQVILQEQGENIRPWFKGDWSLASAMTYHELITAQREVKKMGKIFYTVDYRALGMDWMDNVLFTTADIMKKAPQVVQAIVTGRYKGFLWAMQNPREAIDLVKRTNEARDVLRELDAVDPVKALLITPETKKHGLGYVNPRKWENIARAMTKAGLLEAMPDVRKITSEKFPSGIIPK
jgi:NitT/TauT family transport system substrate-binding protein